MGENKRTLTEIRMSEKAKAAGTVLDERYELKRPVGYGGFSIVYDAVNLHSGQRVAIKECTDRANKDRFMREARLLRDFSDEPAIVEVLDYFEEDGVAYIVMEFLEGKTLREEINENGVWDAEKTVRLFDPVMKTLERMHKVGVIHRDISPDNLMLLEDGSLKLLDFGAARENIDKTVSKLVVKASYSPPEQMDEKGKMGSWSDVYSTCATMYYCLTGNNPEDALSRMFLDELKAPTRFGANILAAAEKTLMKGLSIENRNRVQDMHQLREELEKTYPILTEEEKLAIKKKKKRRKILAIATAVVVVAGFGVIANIYKLQILLRFTDTVEFILDGSDMTSAEFKKSAKIVKKRMDVFSDGKMIWDQEKDAIRIVVSQELFKEGVDVTDYMYYVVARPLNLSLSVTDEDGKRQVVDNISQTEDVEGAFTEDDGITVRMVLSESGQEKMQGLLDQKGLKAQLIYDRDSESPIYTRAECVGDGKSILLIQEGDEMFPIPPDLFTTLITTPPSAETFSVTRNWEKDVKWEDPKAALIVGKKQLNKSDLDSKVRDKTVITVLYNGIGRNDDSKEGYDMERIGSQTIIKNRLDAMGIAYAIGEDTLNTDSIAVRLAVDDLCREELLLLGNGLYFDSGWNIGKDIYNKKIDYSYNIEMAEDEEDEPVIRVTPSYYTSDKAKKEIRTFLHSLKQEKEEYTYLRWRNFVVAKIKTKDALKMFDEEGAIRFHEWCVTDEGKKYIRQFQDFYTVGVEQRPESSLSLEDISWDKNKIGVLDELLKCNPSMFESRIKFRDAFAQWEEKYTGTLTFSEEFYNSFLDGHYSIRIWINEKIRDQITEKEAIEILSRFYDNHERELKDAGVEDLLFEVNDGLVKIVADTDKGEYYIYKGSGFDRLNEEYKEYIRQDSVLGKLEIKDPYNS